MKFCNLLVLAAFIMISVSAGDVVAPPTPTPEPIDPGLIVTPTAKTVYPDFNKMEFSISGDGRDNQRHMIVVVPLFDATSRQRSGQWVYDFRGKEYNDAQAAFVSDKALFKSLLAKVGAPPITLTNQPENLVNVIPANPSNPAFGPRSIPSIIRPAAPHGPQN